MGKGKKTMSNSPLVTYTRLSPNCTKPRNHKIDRIVIHHMAGNLTVQQCGAVFAPSSRQASSNYGVDSNGKVGMYVEEKNRSWATSSPATDHRAVTIEVANSKTGGNWPVSAKALKKTIELCADICKRNGIKKLNYTGDKTGNLHMHCWYAATSCPGPYLKSKFSYIAKEVNKLLEAETTKTSTKATAKYSGTLPTLPKRGYFKTGDTGSQVKYLQKFLNWYGKYGLSVDGVLGNMTSLAIKKFQTAEGLVVDGKFGAKSLAKAKTVKK